MRDLILLTQFYGTTNELVMLDPWAASEMFHKHMTSRGKKLVEVSIDDVENEREYETETLLEVLGNDCHSLTVECNGTVVLICHGTPTYRYKKAFSLIAPAQAETVWSNNEVREVAMLVANALGDKLSEVQKPTDKQPLFRVFICPGSSDACERKFGKAPEIIYHNLSVSDFFKGDWIEKGDVQPQFKPFVENKSLPEGQSIFFTRNDSFYWALHATHEIGVIFATVKFPSVFATIQLADFAVELSAERFNAKKRGEYPSMSKIEISLAFRWD